MPVVPVNPPQTIVVPTTPTPQPVVQRVSVADVVERQVGPIVVPPAVVNQPTVQEINIAQVIVEERGPPGPPGPGATFTDPDPTTITVGGIPAGSTFGAPHSVQEMFEALLYPYQAPAFTSFAITGVSSPLEVGQSFGPNVTFTWSISHDGNVAANSIAITDLTTSTVLGTGLVDNGAHAIALGAAVVRTSAGSHQFGIAGADTHSGAFSAQVTYAWAWRCYFGTSGATALTGAEILALASSRLGTGYASTYTFTAGGYKYICLADAVGGQLSSVRDQATGFAVPIAPGSHTDGGGFGYELVTVVNTYGVSTSVRVYRTLNALGGTITLVVT